MAKLARVNMTTGEIKLDDLGDYRAYGGRGLTSLIIAREVPPGAHPLGEKNKLVIAAGLLSGTVAVNSGRLSVGVKSPLTGGIKESNVGGTAAAKLARLGLRALVIEGRPAPGKLFYLLVTAGGLSLLPADEFKGLGNYELADKLKERYGDKATIVSIGPAGERKQAAASVAVTDTKGYPSRHAARGGPGAVMGAKGLKAVVIDDKAAPGVEFQDEAVFKDAAKALRDILMNHPVTKPGSSLSVQGTNGMMALINAVGALPTRNFTAGQFEGVAKVSGEALANLIKQRGGQAGHAACTNCIIHCSNIVPDENGAYLTSGLEYETVWANGPNCGVDDLASIAVIDRLCDDFGLDTMEVGCAIAVAMEAGIIPFGDAAAAQDLVRQAGAGTPLGRIIASGAAMAGRVLGVERTPTVKGQSMSAYDPRGIKGIGVTYATSPMGADHTAGYAVASNLMRIGGHVPPLQAEGQAAISKKYQVSTAVLDALGLCSFIHFAVMDNPAAHQAFASMASALTGEPFAPETISDYGRQILAAEINFNHAAGFTSRDDRLPDFFTTEKLPPHNAVFDVPAADLDSVGDY